MNGGRVARGSALAVAHEIVGMYLADDRLSITDYQVSARSVDLSVGESVASIRYAYELAVAAEYRHVVNTPTADGGGQIVSVCLSYGHSEEDMYVTFRSVQSDPVVVARLRAVAPNRQAERSTIDALIGGAC